MKIFLAKTHLILPRILKCKKNEIDFDSFLALAEENKIIYNQAPVNTLIEGVEKLKNCFFTNGYFTLGDEREFENNNFFQDSNQLAQFLDKIVDKYDDHPLYILQAIFRDILEFLNE